MAYGLAHELAAVARARGDFVLARVSAECNVKCIGYGLPVVRLMYVILKATFASYCFVCVLEKYTRVTINMLQVARKIELLTPAFE